ncbi:protein kinase [Cryptosporangium sp. NPDC048952]|uniref:protein kinase domain-containing protein n=1 Tax=Cryptosporangium sp. NPDC048952 TaxID=3363961 RepID=UPI003714CD53
MTPLLPSDPTLIGRYTVQGRLGAGGMGTVYLGQSPGGRPAAIKVINERFAMQDDSLARFRREVEVLRTVRSAYTAALIDCQLEQPPFWFATEYIPGPTLADAIAQRGPLPPDGAYRLIAALAEGLTDIHQHGICHRDLKPQNVILASTGPQLIDFGIARGAEHVGLTQVGAAIGSPGYAAPEVLARNEVAPPADVFALGATTAYAVTGRKPFGDGTVATILIRSMNGEIDLTGVEPRLAELLRACVAVEPGYRPTPEQIIDACRSQIPAFQPPTDKLSVAGPVSATPMPMPTSGTPLPEADAVTVSVPNAHFGQTPIPPAGANVHFVQPPDPTAGPTAVISGAGAPPVSGGPYPGGASPVSGGPYPGGAPPVSGGPYPGAVPPGAVPPGVPPQFSAAPPPASRTGKTALLVGAAVLVLILVLGGGAFAFVGLSSDSSEANPEAAASKPAPTASAAPATSAAAPSESPDATPSDSPSAEPGKDDGAATAAPVTWVDKATSRCLDGDKGGNVYTFPCNDGDYQRWIPTPIDGGFTFTSKATGLCLDSNAARSVYAMPCNQGDYQVWSVAENGDGQYNLTNKATGFLLDSNEDGQTYAFDANDGDYQRWSRQ